MYYTLRIQFAELLSKGSLFAGFNLETINLHTKVLQREILTVIALRNSNHQRPLILKNLFNTLRRAVLIFELLWPPLFFAR
jgi:hypothetical protein